MKKNIFGNIQEGKASVIIFHDIHQGNSSNKLKVLNKIIQFYNSIRKPQEHIIDNIDLKRRKVILVVNEQLKDIRKKSSRIAYQLNTSKHKINEIYIQNNSSTQTKVRIGIFVRDSLNEIEAIFASGYISDNKDGANRFPYQLEINKDIFHLLEKPTYWFDCDILIPPDIFNDKEIKEFRLVINSLSIKRSDNKIHQYQYISMNENINSTTGNNRSVLILSFDGVSNHDFNNNVGSSNSAHVNKLFHDFIRFKYPQSSATVSASSAASLLTGLGLSRHLIYDYEKWYYDKELITLSENIITLPEKLRSNNYNCYGITAFSKLSPYYGFSRGFNSYENISTGKIQNYGYLDRLVEIINTAKDTPSFIFAHLPGAHPPLLNHFNTDKLNADEMAYQYTLSNAIDIARSIIGLLKELDIYKDYLIIITSDHGKSLHGYRRKGYQFQNSRISVPLLIKMPENVKLISKWSNEVNNYISSSTAIYPLIMDILNIEQPSYFTNYSKRIIGDIHWVTETIDYSSYNRIGLVGFDKEYKWILYFTYNDLEKRTQKFDSVFAYKIQDDIVLDDANDMVKMIDTNRVKKVIGEAEEYLKVGNEFAAQNHCQFQGDYSCLL